MQMPQSSLRVILIACRILITPKMQLINMGILLTGQRASTSLLLGLQIPFENSIQQ